MTEHISIKRCGKTKCFVRFRYYPFHLILASRHAKLPEITMSFEVLNEARELSRQMVSTLENCLANPLIMAYGGAIAGFILWHVKTYVDNLNPLNRASSHIGEVRKQEEINLAIYSVAGAVVGATIGALIGGLPYLR